MTPIIVTGCGFCGTNAVVKMLMDMGYYMGEYWLKPNKKMHPYPVYEDAEFYHAQEMLNQGFNWYLKDLLQRRITHFNNKWGFKAPNNFKYLDVYHHELTTSFKLIACVRDKPTLVSRMHERWYYSHREAHDRIESYLEVVKKYKKLVPTLVINQNLLRKDNDGWRERIQSFIGTS